MSEELTRTAASGPDPTSAPVEGVEEEPSTFVSLGLSPKVLKALTEMGFEEPTPIQARTIPMAMTGRDIIGQAQTGTGKTAAFGVPIVERLDPRKNACQALVLTPTRELCIQVAAEVTRIGRYRDVKTLPVYGGQAIERQLRALRHGVHVIIGTPGRMMDHLNRGTIRLDEVATVVLDEADEMLDMGFAEDLEAILGHVPEVRQTMLFSATMPTEILRLARRYLKDPFRVNVSPERLTVPLTTQEYYELRGHDRVDGLSRILDYENIDRAIIFCRTKKGVDELAEALKGRGYLAEAIHGDLNQAQRDRVMKRFRDGAIELLVATDVAARGLDIEGVTHVINYELPQDAESYVHRIGRTGRAGKTGVAITLVHPREYRQIKNIERIVRTRIQRRELPTLQDLVEKEREMLRARLVGVVQEGNLTEYREVIADLLEEYDPVDLAAAGLKLLSQREAPQTPDEPSDWGDTGAENGMVRLFVNVGRAQGVGPAEIVRSLASESGISGKIIGVIDIYDRFTFVEVPREVAGQVLRGWESINGRVVSVEPARRR